MIWLLRIACFAVGLSLAAAALAFAEKKDPDAKAEREADAGEAAVFAVDREGNAHERRMVQLRRLRDLAVENDRRDMISRVDGLIARELKRHSKELGEEDKLAEDTTESEE